jgi:3-phenylpropionate/trans-cinnamate dioxygenase ferredoxin subunit
LPYLTVCKTSDVRSGDIIAVNVGGQEIAVARKGDSFYAFDNRCTHQQDYMTNGFIEGQTVVCSFHDAIFDMTTGAVLGGPAWDELECFKIRVEGDEVQIDYKYDLPPDSITRVDLDAPEHQIDRERVHHLGPTGTRISSQSTYQLLSVFHTLRLNRMPL